MGPLAPKGKRAICLKADEAAAVLEEPSPNEKPPRPEEAVEEFPNNDAAELAGAAVCEAPA